MNPTSWDQGWWYAAHWIESPNFGPRPAGTPITLIVLHNISLPPGEFGGPYVEQLFTNSLDPAAHPYFAAIAHIPVSAHFYIRRGGEILQFVSTEDRAWHAGQSSWEQKPNCNDYSIGIELEGCDTQAFTPTQYQALWPLLKALEQHHPINAIVGHEHIAPGRKTDPGPHFDWVRVAQHHPELKTPATQKFPT